MDDRKRVPLILVARHGTTEANKKKLFRGATDYPLDDQGFRDANRLAYYFEPMNISYVFSSPRTRAMQTADVICQRLNCDVMKVDDMRAWDIGDFAGLEKTPENIEALQIYIEQPDLCPPNGESLNQFRSRLAPVIEEGIEVSSACEEPILFVSHSSVIHEISAMITGDHMAAKVKPGGVICVYVEGGSLGVDAIFRKDTKSLTQNLLGSKITPDSIS